MKTLIITLLLAPLSCLGANTGPQPATAKEAPAGKKAPAAAKEATAVVPDVTPSRFVAKDLDKYILDLRKRLAVNRKQRGPFGLSQIPGEAPVVRARPMFRKRIETPFSDVINEINISAVFAAEKEFMVQSQIFRLGQVFEIPVQNQVITCRVEAVKSTSVTFKNMKSGEIAHRRLDLLPAGVQLGGGPNTVPPGVTATNKRKRAVLKIDSLTPPPTP